MYTYWLSGPQLNKHTYLASANAGSCGSRAILCFGAALSRLLCLLPFLFGKIDPPKPRESRALCVLHVVDLRSFFYDMT
jgi:hypothetical protein